MKVSALLAGFRTLVYLSWVFLKVGFVFFGGGYLLIPILHRELVVGLRWLTQQEFVDGVALVSSRPALSPSSPRFAVSDMRALPGPFSPLCSFSCRRLSSW